MAWRVDEVDEEAIAILLLGHVGQVRIFQLIVERYSTAVEGEEGGGREGGREGGGEREGGRGRWKQWREIR